MFIGHLAVGIAAKRLSPRINLGALLLASQWLDVVWPVLVLAGVERVKIDHQATAFTPLDLVYMPWSHSLLMTGVWSALAFSLVTVLRGSTRDGLLVAAVVFSHWMLDLLSHRPDLPLAFGETRLGLGLWDSIPGTLVVEGGMWLGAIVLYTRGTEARGPIGSLGWWLLVGVVSCIYLASAFGPRPPEDAPAAAIAGLTLALVLFCAWGSWVDRHRRPLWGTTSVTTSG